MNVKTRTRAFSTFWGMAMGQVIRKKLSRADRREQLLETADRVIAEAGADALTMGALAEKAGVSKPVVYDHFGSRSGLLIALYRRADQQHMAAIVDAVELASDSLADIASIVAAAYMQCSTNAGTQWYAISAALKGDEEMNCVQRTLMDDYLAFYCDLFSPFSTLDAHAHRLRCIGILGAAEALSENMVRGSVGETEAAETLARMIECSII